MPDQVGEALEAASATKATEPVPTPDLSNDWRSQLSAAEFGPQDIAKLEKFKAASPQEGLSKLAKSYLGIQDQVSSSIKVPGENATVEEMRAFHAKLGAPETHESYSVPEGDQVVQGIVSDLRTVAHDAGLSVKQWEAISQGAVKLQGKQAEQAQELLGDVAKQFEKQISEEYGGSASEKMATSQRFFNKLVPEGDPLRKVMDLTTLSKHPGFVKLFLKVQELAGNDKMPESIDDLKGRPMEIPKDSLEECMKKAVRVREILVCDEMRDKYHPKHDLMLAEFYKLEKEIDAAGYKGATDPRLNPDPLADVGGRSGF